MAERIYVSTHPPQDDVDLHTEEESVQQDQQAGDAVAQLPGTDAVLSVLGKFDGFHDKSQHPVDQQSWRDETMRRTVNRWSLPSKLQI